MSCYRRRDIRRRSQNATGAKANGHAALPLPPTRQPSSSKARFGVGELPGVPALGVRVAAAEPVLIGEAVGVLMPGVPVGVVTVPPVAVTVALAVPTGEPVGVTALNV